MGEVPSPEEFAKEMKAIEKMYGDDFELKHMRMDMLLCRVLKSLGYEKGVEIFNNTEMWYA